METTQSKKTYNIWVGTLEEYKAILKFRVQCDAITDELYLICYQLGISIPDFIEAFEYCDVGPIRNKESARRLMNYGIATKYLKNLRLYEELLNEIDTIFRNFANGEFDCWMHSDSKIVKKNYEESREGGRFFKTKLWQLGVFARRSNPEWWEEDNKIRDACAKARVEKSYFDTLKDKAPDLYERLRKTKEIQELEEMADLDNPKLQYI